MAAMDPVPSAPLDPVPPGGSLSAAPLVVPPVRFRRFDDIEGQREDIYNSALEALRSFKPVENASHRLELADVDYDGPFTPTKSDEKRMIMEGTTLHRPVRGTVRLIDKVTEQPVDEQRVTVARIPHLNSRGLFIRNGVVWSVRNQARLRPGAYTRRRADGGTETHFNVKPGTGRGFRIVLEPESGLMKMQIGQSTTRLYPILRKLGYEDEQIKEAWGEELYEKNYRAPTANDLKDLKKVVSKLGSSQVDVDDDQLPQALRDILERAEIDPETAKMTLGQPIQNLSPDVLLQATRRVLGVARGQEGEDNRDSQAFQSIHSAEDFIRERLGRDQVGALRKVLWKAAREGKLGKLPTGVMDKNIGALFEGSGLSLAVEDINPFEIYDQRQAITRMGQGGISSEQAVSRGARGVQASYLGVIDAARGPECYDAQTEVMTRRGWVPWPEVSLEDEFACLMGGSVSYHSPIALHASEWRGRMCGISNTHIDLLVTPNHRMWSRCYGSLRDGRECAYNIKLAEDFRGHRLVRTSGFGVYEPEVPETEFVLPVVEATGATDGSNGRPPVGARLITHTEPINITDWLSFLGWFLSEGNTDIQVRGQRGSYKTLITQVESANPDNVAEIKQLLDRLPFTWHYARGETFCVSGKQLALYLLQFGLAQDKFIPWYVFESSVEARWAFVDALLKGGGKRWHGSDDRRTLHTTSQRLAKDFQRLMFSLGKSTKHTVLVDEREDRYLDIHGVYIHTRDERLITPTPPRRDTSDYYTVEDFRGTVYCATVPGGLLYVRRNNHLGFWCGNSSKLGLDLRVTDAALKGSDNQLYTTVRNLQTGEPEIVSARDLSTKVVAFPGELEREGKRVPAIKGDKIQYVPRDEVDYAIRDPGDLMSRATSMIPFPQSIKGQRLLMGSRMVQQSMPLKDPEAPLVQTAGADGQSTYKEMGRYVGAARSPVRGTVVQVDNDQVKIRTPEGQTKVVDLYNNYPSARKTMLHNTPMVERGQQVEPGDLIARSNFTDEQGTAAPGKNLRVAYMAAEGRTIEDAFVISESAARKLTSEALYKSDLDLSDVDSTGKADYQAVYSDKYSSEQYQKVDDEGVVRVGAEVQPGDPLILGFGRKDQKAIGAVMDTPRSQLSDRSQTWEHHAPGVVTDVTKTRKGIKVSVKSYDPMKAADKLSARFGNKGVASEIVPDDQMPMDQNGRPVEVIANALGIVSRTNPGALAEALLGKVAEARGEPYVVKGFDQDDVTEFALQEALKYGVIEQDPETGKIRDTETLTDPRDGSKIPNVFTGTSYFMKPQHMAEGKLSARDVGTYTMEGAPARGGSEGCFFASQKILTDQGSVEIGHLCEKRLGLSVLTWNGEDWVYRPVTDWFIRRAHVSELITVEFMAPTADRLTFKKGSSRQVAQAFSATTNHEIFLADGRKVMAGQLRAGDELITCGTEPTGDQRAVNRLTAVPTRVLSVGPYIHDKPGVTDINVYDITVDDTHAYCAGGALVSNSKRVALLDSHALLAAGATDFLKDAKLIRGQRNDDYWRAVRAGETPTAPDRSFANDHFKDLLRGAGVNLREEGTRSQLSPMLDRDVDQLAEHEIEGPGTFDFESMRPVKGGLFDIAATGGAGGQRFSKITLPKPVPHPLFVEPIQRLLGLTNKDLQLVMRGEKKIGDKTGPEALEQALGSIDIEREMNLAKELIRTGRGQSRDQAVKRLNYLVGLKKMGVEPQELMITKIPVVPPKYRPISSARGMDIVHDLNYLYHDLLESRKNYREATETFGEAGDEYQTMADAVRAISGMRDPVNQKTAEQGVKGILRHAIGVGDTPKRAQYQRKVLGSAVDTVGRGVITSDADLNMDQVSIPKDMAYRVYRPHIIRRLTRLGMPASESIDAVDKQSSVARKALEAEMEERPVVYNRAPALHRYAYVGAYPRLRDDDAIGLPYHTLKGLNADYDGNCAAGWSTVQLTVAADYYDVAQEYQAMRTSPTTRILAIGESQVLAEIEIKDFPHRPDTGRLDKNGATVYEVPDGVAVASYNHLTGETGFFPVTSFTVDPDKQVREVVTQRRRSVTVSDNESLVVYNHNTGELEKETPDNSVGRIVPAFRRSPTITTVTMAAESGWVYGAFVGDGFITGGRIGFTKLDGETREYFAKHLEGLTRSFNGRFSQSRDYLGVAGPAKLGASCKNHFGVGDLWAHLSDVCYSVPPEARSARSALYKQLPTGFLSWCEVARVGLLTGLIDTDGSVSLNKSRGKPQLLINYATSSESLRDDLIQLCRSLGIHASYSVTRCSAKRLQRHDSYTVIISTADVREQLGSLPLVNAAKKKILDENLPGVSPNNFDFVPLPVDVLNWLCSADGPYADDRRSRGVYQTLRSKQLYPKSARWVAERVVQWVEEQGLTDTAPAAWPAWSALVRNKDVTWDVVKESTEVGVIDTYDLGVPDTKIFAVNGGLIIQDTINVHVPASAEAVRDAREKLMPSKNLLFTGDFETHYEPVQDYLAGLYLASTPDTDEPIHTFVSEEEARRAFSRGEINARTPIRILE